jgi:hypothetical protein
MARVVFGSRIPSSWLERLVVASRVFRFFLLVYEVVVGECGGVEYSVCGVVFC